MGQWADLPTELAILILEELSDPLFPFVDHRAQNDLLQCSYVSHHFHVITEPLLYRDVRLRVPAASENGEVSSFFPCICQFTRAVLLKPRLGTHVHRLFAESLGTEYDDFELNIARWKECFDEKEVPKILLDENVARSDLSIILDALPGMGLSNSLVLHGRSDGVFIVLLHLLPKLRLLDIRTKVDLAYIAYASFGGFGGGIPASLQSISELSLVPEDYDIYTGGFSADEFVPFMVLPSLHTMIVHRVYEAPNRTSWLRLSASTANISSELLPSALHNLPSPAFLKRPNGYTILPRSSSITSLRLEDSTARCTLLSRILMLPIRLETLEYQIGDVYDVPFYPSHFLPGLLSHASSLRELNITVMVYNRDWSDDEPFIGSLSGMTALETLRVPLLVLLPDVEELANDVDHEDGYDQDARAKDGWPLHLLNPYLAPANTRNPWIISSPLTSGRSRSI